jgi:hypothetical protein
MRGTIIFLLLHILDYYSSMVISIAYWVKICNSKAFIANLVLYKILSCVQLKIWCLSINFFIFHPSIHNLSINLAIQYLL